MQRIRSILATAGPHRIPARHEHKLVELRVLPGSIEAICQDEQHKLIDRTSRTLATSENNYTTVEKNLLCLILAYDKFGPFLSPVHTTFLVESKEFVKIFEMSTPHKRIENLMLRLTPEMEPKFKLLETSTAAQITRARLSKKPPDAVIFTDGASYHNGRPDCRASWAVYLPDHPHLSAAGLVTVNPSNQTAEMTAAIKACEIARHNKFHRITVVTDSKYVINAITTWLDRWTKS